MFGKKVSLLFIVFALTFLACSLVRSGGETDAQNNEATITAYTALEQEQVERYLAAFNREYPNISVNVVRDSTGVITERILREGTETPADVIWGLAVTSILLTQAQGILEPYAPAGLERVDPRFRDSGQPPAWVGIDVCRC